MHDVAGTLTCEEEHKQQSHAFFIAVKHNDKIFIFALMISHRILPIIIVSSSPCISFIILHSHI